MSRRAVTSGATHAPVFLARRALTAACIAVFATAFQARAGDILRGGAVAPRNRPPEQVTNAGAKAALAAQKTAKDRLARTTQAIQTARTLQQAARGTALARQGAGGLRKLLPGDRHNLLQSVPNGLRPGGLDLVGDPVGALRPTQSIYAKKVNVTIKQTDSHALLEWKTFNIGKRTNLTFDQSAGGADTTDWIAFNRVTDPSGRPSQILGSIKAAGQVYIINQNGIIFGGSSQVNVHTLVASSLPINDNLIESGLLNNRDAQFLFSTLSVPGGSDGTNEFIPPPVLRVNGQPGEVTVERGAILESPETSSGSGGRIMLVGANVNNDGSISTPNGQTILAAGLQVGIAAHSSDDPSLRGLDVYIGDVGHGRYGSVTHTGLIEAPRGSILLAGREINQLGVLSSTTSVDLNGRIDLLASYGAVGNPNFDNASQPGAGAPPFFSQSTGVVRFGQDSVTAILPEYSSTKTVPGTELAVHSQIHVDGAAVYLDQGSIIHAPGAEVTVRAGIWPFKDADGTRTILLPDGSVQPELNSNLDGTQQQFLFDGGQIFVDRGALLDVSGTTDAFVPLSQNVVTVQLRGSELANSPVQRNSAIRGQDLVVDLRETGTYNGQYWIGTPLGDLTGFANIIERDVSQLSTQGGTVTLQAGDAIVVQQNATIDVSGGYFRNEGGRVQTSRLVQGPRVIDIANATPGMVYDGIYNGEHTEVSSKWGISNTYRHALAPLGAGNTSETISGAGGGTINLTAPSMVLGGDLVGRTIQGPRQLDNPPELASLSIALRKQKAIEVSANNIQFFDTAPFSPTIHFVPGGSKGIAPEFAIVKGRLRPLPKFLQNYLAIGTDLFAPEGGGFGHVSIDNRDGAVYVPRGVPIAIQPGGSLTIAAGNIAIKEDIVAPGGDISLTAYNYSPFKYAALDALGYFVTHPQPRPRSTRGIISIGSGVRLDVAGRQIDERPSARFAATGSRILDGGSVSLEGYSIFLGEDSVIDASGGVRIAPKGDVTYGDGGDIALLAGKDPNLSTSIGGELLLGGELRSYSGAQGGALSIQASLIQIGGEATQPNTLYLQPGFFRKGGFTRYSLTAIGQLVPGTGKTLPGLGLLPARYVEPEYMPAIRIAEGTVIEPVAETWRLDRTPGRDQSFRLTPTLQDVGVRPAVSVELKALGADDPFTLDLIETRGDIVMEKGARIATDPGGSVSITGQTVSINGTISAPGGAISIIGADQFPRTDAERLNATYALPTVYIGPQARLSAAGTAVQLPDPYGRRTGILYPGGSIYISGNIVAESDALLDVSGSTAVFAVHPSRLAAASGSPVPLTAGLNSEPYLRRGVPTRFDSDGGSITLRGSEMLFSDASLVGRAGGPTAAGGTLSVSSGRFYGVNDARTGADINLIVRQSGLTLPKTNRHAGIGVPVLGPDRKNEQILPGMGYFIADRFIDGGFDSLDLGFEYRENASPIPFGGNVKFIGPVTIAARGSIRVAGGGIIEADAPVSLTAPYIALGQEFREPQNPNDIFVPFTRDPAIPSSQFFPTPTYGPGRLSVNADLIDIGTLVLQNTGEAVFSAKNGDIRGEGTLSIAGRLTLEAGQVYPTTLGQFDIFAYDYTVSKKGVDIARPGIVRIKQSGSRPLPYSVGGSLRIFASEILQNGTLRAPLGSITLGWDGLDLNPDTSEVDAPVNAVVGTNLSAPKARKVLLGKNSVTSVSAVDERTGEVLRIPFGNSPDGLSWIDPRGVNVTVAGLPRKSISIAGDQVVTAAGSVVDIQGGGELYAYRWISGQRGNIDILGVATRDWTPGTYSAGDLVRYNGKTFSARIEHSDPQPPSVGSNWSLVPESYAVVPGYDSEFAPYSPFNTSQNADALAGDPGLIDSTLSIGDRIFLDGTSGLPAGIYTLLPRRFALQPGAFLVTAQSAAATDGIDSHTTPEGAAFVSGYRFNQFSRGVSLNTTRTLFEVASPEVVANRAEYEIYDASTFLPDAAKRLDIATVQELPRDAGYLGFHGNSSLRLFGDVFTRFPEEGRGASIDISSLEDIYIVGGRGKAPKDARVVLGARRLTSWGAESLLIGGLRRETEDGVRIDVRAGNIFVDNAGSVLAAPDVTLAANETVALQSGSAVLSSGPLTRSATTFLLAGDGALLRVSGDKTAAIGRETITGSTLPLLSIGAGARISGAGVILDSTYGTTLDPRALLEAEHLTLGSGQISLVLGDHESGSLAGAVVDPHLVLSGDLLQQIQSLEALTLRSYRTIDLYGSGAFGSSSLKNLSLLASGIRGFDQGEGSVLIRAGRVVLSNPSNAGALPGSGSPATGGLQFRTRVVEIGSNDFAIQGYAALDLNARGGILGTGVGNFSTEGSLVASAPLITGDRGSTHTITAGGAIALLGGLGENKPTVRGGFGAGLTFTGTSILANTAIVVPSGLLTLHATAGDVTVGGRLVAGGRGRKFYDIIRYADAGSITLQSDQGNVTLLPDSVVSVAAAPGGGNGGTLSISAPQGLFAVEGEIRGRGGRGGTDGRFLLDAGSVESFNTLSDLLSVGEFLEEQNIRIRNGDIDVGGAIHARNFTLSADQGSIAVSGIIDASGITGGSIALIARDNIVIGENAVLTVAAQQFNNAGKGGSILLEAGAQRDGVVNTNAQLDLREGALLDLSVADYVPGDYTEVGSSAFNGQFQGTLHLRAPRNAANTDLGIKPIGASIFGASSIIAEGYELYDLTGTNGVITGWRTSQTALPTAGTLQRTIYNSANSFLSQANYDAMVLRLLGSSNSALLENFVLAPGVEIINRSGDITLGLTNGTSLGSAALNSADWILSDFRFGSKKAPGILTLRASGDLVFNNALSDGFTPVAVNQTNGHSALWLGRLQSINADLPVNTQSWSFRLSAGADTSAADARAVLSDTALAAGKGSVLVGQFYSAIPNTSQSGSGAAVGSNGLTANTISISGSAVNNGTRYEVIRTGTGDIEVNAGRDVQLRNQFATIYSAGVALPDPTKIFSVGDFVLPVVNISTTIHPSQGNLGAIQQRYTPVWAMAGGDVSVSAQRNIGRYTQDSSGNLIVDSSRQLPNNWLYRRGYLNPDTGLFGVGGVDGTTSFQKVTDPSASTAWWIDYSNFFEGFGALGGGNVSLAAGNDIINADAVAPTSARMAGLSNGQPIAPDSNNLLELGGGDVRVTSGRDISGGVYYVERGQGKLFAGGEITTNAARSPSRYILGSSIQPSSIIESVTPAVFDSKTWLPTTLFAGDAQFEVNARGDILLGPVTNTFLLPQGLNNKFWYKTYFNTFSPDASVTVASFGGSVTHRLAVTLPGGGAQSQPILQAWLQNQNLFAGSISGNSVSNFQPWLRLAETDISSFNTVLQLSVPSIKSTAFAGDINIVGNLTLFPSSVGGLELAASDGIIGLQPTGRALINNRPLTAYASSTVNVSDADPAAFPDVTTPLGYTTFVGRRLIDARSSRVDPFRNLNSLFQETGSYTGQDAAVDIQQALHGSTLLHADDPNPVRLYAGSSDITGLTLFTPKFTRIIADRDITDVSFYIQHVNENDVSLVSAGRDIIPFNENASLRSLANNLDLGNIVGDPASGTTSGDLTNALQGDIQISGRGYLQVIAGRNIDLGTGANFTDGTGTGITAIGNSRNPFLAFDGANILAIAGVGGRFGGAASSLASSSLNFETLLSQTLGDEGSIPVGITVPEDFTTLDALTQEQRNLLALEVFFNELRLAGSEAAAPNGTYDRGFRAISTLFGSEVRNGEIQTRSRDIRTITGGEITLLAPGGGITLASDIFGNPRTPPGVVTEYGGRINIFTRENVDIGQARIFTLRGGDITIWSSTGDIAAGSSPRTVVTAPPTRVVLNATSATVETDLGGLATGGGIGVLAAVEDVPPGDVFLVAPEGTVDAGDAGVRATGNVTIAAVQVLNADTIQAAGNVAGVPSTPPAAAPNVAGLTAASNTAAANTNAANDIAQQNLGRQETEQELTPSIITVDVLGYGGSEDDLSGQAQLQSGRALPASSDYGDQSSPP